MLFYAASCVTSYRADAQIRCRSVMLSPLRQRADEAVTCLRCAFDTRWFITIAAAMLRRRYAFIDSTLRSYTRRCRRRFYTPPTYAFAFAISDAHMLIRHDIEELRRHIIFTLSIRYELRAQAAY